MRFLKFFVCLLTSLLFTVPGGARAGEDQDAKYLQQIRNAESGGTIENFEKSWCTIAQHRVKQGLQYKMAGESLERAIQSVMFEAELDGRIAEDTSPKKRRLIHSFTSYYFTFVYETEGTARFILNKAKKLACLDKTLFPPEVKKVIAGAKRAREQEGLTASANN